MRFLILTQYYSPEVGAPQVRLREMVRALKSHGHEVEVFTALPNYPIGKISQRYQGCFSKIEIIDGVDVHRVWIYGATGFGLKRLLSYFSFCLFALLALVKCQRADYVFVESPPLFLSLPAFILSRYWQAKMIFNVSDLWPDSAIVLGLVENKAILQLAEGLELWSYRQAAKVSAVTEGIRQSLLDKGVPAHKVLFLPNGVNTELFSPRPADAELSTQLGLDGKKVILYAGTLGYSQGLETVLAAAELLKHREEIVFIFIGGGSDKPRVQALAQDKALPNVRFLDPAPPEYVARLYSLALAGLAVLRDIPLFKGARPSKIFPSMASGVPVLYSGAGEAAVLVVDNGAGLAIPPENPGALAAAVLQLAEDPALAHTLGQNARRFAEQELNWQALVGTWLSQLLKS